MSRVFFQVMLGFVMLLSPVFAVEFKCAGQEKGINSMTGVERIIPFAYHIVIANNKATIKDYEYIDFNVDETDDSYTLKSVIGNKSKDSATSRISGEYMLQIDKHTRRLTGKSWLFHRDNVVTKEGSCEIITDSD